MKNIARFGCLLLAVSCAVIIGQTITPNANTTPQSAQVITAFGTVLSVTVKDATNSPVNGVVVTFTAPPGPSVASGIFTDSGNNVTTAMTNASGVATAATFTANTHAGSYNVTATATGYPTANFALTNTAGPATQMTASANTTPQSAQVGTPFPTLLGVTLQDANNNPVPGVIVTFTAPAQTGASGTFGNNTGTTQATTNASGVATATTVTANTHAGGPYTVTATATGPPTVNFSLTNTPNTASKLAFTTQPPSNGTAGTAFSVVVQVQDSNGIVVGTSSAQVTITSTAPGVTGTTTVTALNGVATLGNLIFNSTGSYTLTAASSGLTSATSTSITIGAAAASQVVFTTPPSNGTVGQALTPAVVAKIEDAFGNVVNSSAQVTASSTPAGLSGTLQVNAVSGVATFSNLSFGTAGTYTLTASSVGLTSANSASFSILPGSPSKLVITSQPPANGTAGQPLTPSVVVQVQDASGNVVTGSTAAVTISSTPAGVTGTLTMNAVAGVATFSNLTFNTVGTYSLTASSTGLTSATSSSVAIGAGSATKLVFSTQPPANGTAGQPLTPSVVVQVQDAGGNVVTGSTAAVTISSTPAGVTGTLTMNAVAGVATFSNLTFNTVGTYSLTASSTGLTSATSSSVAIGAGPAASVVFLQQPVGGTAGQPLTPAVTVKVQDSNGNLVTTSGAAVSITSTPAGLVGAPVTVNAVNGVATFSALSFTSTGSYTLTAASTGLTPATSNSFAIAPGSGNKLAITTPPPSIATSGQAVTMVVQIQDSNSNLVTSSTAAVTISSTPLGVSGTLTANAVGGIATFSNLVFGPVGIYSLTATSPGVSNAVSTPVTIGPGSPAKLAFTAVPSIGTAGQALSPAVTVLIQDAAGNQITNSAAAVSISSTPAGVIGALTVNAVNGLATFSSLFFSSTGNFTLTAASAGLTNANSTSITVVGALTITTPSMNPATRLAPFSQQLIATGGVLPYTWSITSGALAGGLSLSTSGFVSGTPTVTGNFPFTARVRDSLGATADQPLTLVVANGLAISACPASSGIVGQAYSSTVVATGGTLPFTWGFSTGSLPPGLTLNVLTGAVTGTPTASGVFPVTLQVSDRSGATASLSCGFTIAPALSVTTLTLSDASLASPYSQTLLASGGKGPYTWTVSGGALPPGVTLSSNGVLSGTPTQQGFFSFTITVTDSTQASVQQAYTINVAAGLIVGACPSNIAEVGLAYNSALVAQGGTPPYTWSVAGTLPAGLQLNAAAGTIAGTPTLVGVSQLTFTTTDKSSRNATKQCSIEVRAALTVTTATLSQGSTGASYSDAVAVSGGVQPFVFSTTAGSLPPGISLDAGSGKLSGRPTASGSFNFTASVSDNVGAQATKNLSIVVTAGLTIPDCPTPVANVGQAYSGTLVAQSGASPYVWTISSGALPAGLALDSPNSVIAGVPTASGPSAFVLRVDDAAANNVTRACSIQVNAAPLTITSAASVPNAQIGAAYSQTLTATGGAGPYSWSVASGTLPPSLTLDPAGVLSGTPSTAGTFSFTVQVADQSSNVARQNITLVVLAGTAPAVTITGLSDIVDAATQPTFNIQLAGAYPAPLDGTVTLTVVPDPVIGMVDPAVQFATGGQTLKFTVAANSTTPVFTAPVVALQTGTVAGTIQLSVKLSSNGSDVTPPNTAVRSIRIDRLAPRIVSMSVVRTSSGLEVRIVGYSTTREVTQGSFTFSVSGGSPLSAVVPMSDAGKSWFGSQQSLTFGGQFSLVQPFTLQGSVGTLTSVSATLSNAQGTSPAVSANF